MDKSELREQMLKQRETMGKEEVAGKSIKIGKKILSFHSFQQARSILFYNAINNEVSLKEVMNAALKNNQVAVLPITDSLSRQLKPAQINNLQTDLKEGYAGILEPKENCSLFNAEELDLIFVPGIAFDLKGNRLGRGKGYYDRFLEESTAVKVGLAYEFQVVDSLPAETRDLPVDYIITEERIISCCQPTQPIQSTQSSQPRQPIPLESDPEVARIIKREEQKQQDKLSMIPSENFFSKAVREAVGSVFMHKYAEGNINQRYYEGNSFVDELEKLTIERAKKVFKLPNDWNVNVQALAGSNANLAVYLALLEVGDTMMGMYLPDGGHLSQGWSFEPEVIQDPNNLVYLGGRKKINLTSRIFNVVQYKTNPQTQVFDYDKIEKIALKYKPALIITGGTAYPREINHQRVKEIALKAGALYLADIAHEAGLIAAGVNASPIGIADIVTLTTHKTLRSGRGALILAPHDLIERINKAILPGLQGGPFINNMAGICVGLGEAMKPEFKTYAQQTVRNAQFLGEELKKQGFQLVSGGTDKHLLLIDLVNKPLQGKMFSRALDHAGIITNKNTMPQERGTPMNPSAVRLGTPWLTTRGMKETEMAKIARWINQVMEICTPWKDLKFKEFEERIKDSSEIKIIAEEVESLCRRFPLEI